MSISIRPAPYIFISNSESMTVAGRVGLAAWLRALQDSSKRSRSGHASHKVAIAALTKGCATVTAMLFWPTNSAGSSLV